MTDQHPITPLPELVQQWSDIKPMGDAVVQNWVKIATAAAQWGADQELEACCVLMDEWGLDGKDLMECRRPKPPSLKEQALGALGRFNTNAHTRADDMTQDFDLIRRALKALDD